MAEATGRDAEQGGGRRQSSTPSSPLPSAEAIPRLTSIAAGIFVPIDADTNLLGPFTPPATRVERLRTILDIFNSHEARVRDNLTTLCRRECLRLTLEAQAQEVNHVYPESTSAAAKLARRDDMASMIANMAAPMDWPVKDYNIVDIPVPDFSAVVPTSPREWVVKEIMAVLSKAMTDLNGFDKHVATTREFYEAALKRELEREAL